MIKRIHRANLTGGGGSSIVLLGLDFYGLQWQKC